MPIYFVTGNHEYILENYNQLLSELATVNITWLDNDAVILDDIQIVGVNDYLNRSEKARLIHDLSDLKHYVIALVHKPLSFKSLMSIPDLMLSGHTHNGQLFPFGLLVKLSFPQSYGLYKHGESCLYVSSGVGMWGSSMRFGTQNELIYLTLKPK
jgi:predicted MPP superfamily phosphohydrolase